MAKMTLDDLEFSGKRVLMRVDFNVPIEGGKVADDTRIRAALDSIQHILDAGASVILMSHLGRPKGKVVEEMRMAPVGARLSELIGKEVKVTADCIGPEATEAAKAMQPGDVILLENLRFHAEEEANEPGFAKEIASLGDVYVDDAFGTSHRAHASTEGITRHLEKAVVGRLIERELDHFGQALSDPKRPFVAVLGGAKVKDKIPVIANLLGKVDTLLIGGAMAYTFCKVRGDEVGSSLVDDEHLDLAEKLMADAESKGVKFLLPVDHVVAKSIDDAAGMQTVSAADGIEPGLMGVDIGPETAKAYADEIGNAGTVVWNGPMGVFETDEFAAGTFAVARACAESRAVTLIGGGDSVSAVNLSGLADRMTHVSTGGGASLDLLAGKRLPGLEAIAER